MACVAVASLLRTIELEFFQYKPRPLVLHYHLISPNKDLIQSFHQNLGFLITQFDDKRINMDGVEAVKHLETKLRDLAFRVEDEIEFLVADLYDDEYLDGIAYLFVEEEDELDLYVEKPQRDTDAEKKTQPCLKLGQVFQTAMEQIGAIKEELVKIKAEAGRKTAHDVLQSSQLFSSQYASHSKEQMVGKKDEFEIIKKLLTELGSKEKKVVSVIGMGGIGKTTLTRRVYADPSIFLHFDVRAWAVASQLHNKRQMLVSLLNSISKQDNIEKSSDEELALKLYQCLKRQRYMVVVDDVWSREAWDDVSNCFPDDRNGSRVLLTTRLAEVANYTSSDNHFSHHMQLLDQNDSWNLFCEKAGESRGADFEIIGRPIVEKCKGLPLAIIVVAGLFSKLNTLNEWENIAKALDSSTTTIAATCSKVLSLSYNHLPHHLKACFLYLGVFPEDDVINANNLSRLWSAEGLVKASENENFDVVAERYIQELMDRNLILVRKWSCCGRRIKLFGVHDLLHAFCVKEAQKENLLYVVRENGSDFPKRGVRWVSIQSSNFDVSILCYSSRSCRSIFCFSECESLNLIQFKLLRVFFCISYEMCKNIVDVVHLRYLPPAIVNQNIMELFKTWNLQTLYTCADHRNYLEFPQLQYFFCSFITGNPPKFVHQNLQSLSWLRPNHCTKEFFTHVPNVKKIRIAGKQRECNDCIENLVSLQRLERLYIITNRLHYTRPNMILINSRIVLLKSLKRLKFLGNCFGWNEINVLCKLPKLEVLKLYYHACVGEQWELPEDDKFCQLIVFEIDATDLKDWKATGDHFPKLEHLSLFSCKTLKEIPSGFAEIERLKSIKLAGCRPSVVASAEEIKQDQLDYMNNIVNVVVGKHHGYPLAYESELDESLVG